MFLLGEIINDIIEENGGQLCKKKLLFQTIRFIAINYLVPRTQQNLQFFLVEMNKYLVFLEVREQLIVVKLIPLSLTKRMKQLNYWDYNY